MKTTFLNLTIILTLPLSGVVFAEDFSGKSNDELFNMISQVQTMDTETRNAYRTERQNRMGNMDQSERHSRFANMGAIRGKNMEQRGQNNQLRKRDGSGGGKQYGNGRNGQGRDNQYGSNI